MSYVAIELYVKKHKPVYSTSGGHAGQMLAAWLAQASSGMLGRVSTWMGGRQVLTG